MTRLHLRSLAIKHRRADRRSKLVAADLSVFVWRERHPTPLRRRRPQCGWATPIYGCSWSSFGVRHRGRQRRAGLVYLRAARELSKGLALQIGLRGERKRIRASHPQAVTRQARARNSLSGLIGHLARWPGTSLDW
jgi:hypothetical protein